MKTALIMEGGAMRGMFTCGVTDVFLEEGISFDAAAGISAGACFGCNFKSRQAGRAIRYNKRYSRDPRFCSIRSLIKTGDLYGADFCYRELPDVLDVFDRQAFSDNPLPFYVGATDVIDGDISVKAHASFDDTTTALATVGTHNVEISVTNSLGDTSRLVIPVKVVEDVPHSENIPLKAYLVYVKKGESFDPAFYLANADQAQGSSTMGESTIQIDSNVNPATAGVYSVDYSLMKNDMISAITRLIVVVE